MRNPSLAPMTAPRESGQTAKEGADSAAPSPTGRDGDRGQAAQGPSPQPVSAAENPAPAPPADSPAEARGRRTLSTAFVMIGAGGHLTVELHNGRVIALRDVVMRPRDYCGVQAFGDSAGRRYCGTYGDVATARPGGPPPPAGANPA